MPLLTLPKQPPTVRVINNHFPAAIRLTSQDQEDLDQPVTGLGQVCMGLVAGIVPPLISMWSVPFRML
ncbi:hypothetical protein [Pseudophaeobacter arcticus]|uniref:hypothetical protein n=1 Tax=Pseudophaeobacter arcticus TaxID=385492 RepID=UPI003A975030